MTLNWAGPFIKTVAKSRPYKRPSLSTYASPPNWANLAEGWACAQPQTVGCAGKLEIISPNPSFYKREKMSPTELIHRANPCQCLFISRFCALSKDSPEYEVSHLAFDGSNYSKQSERWCYGAAFNPNSNFQILLGLISFPVCKRTWRYTRSSQQACTLRVCEGPLSPNVGRNSRRPPNQTTTLRTPFVKGKGINIFLDPKRSSPRRPIWLQIEVSIASAKLFEVTPGNLLSSWLEGSWVQSWHTLKNPGPQFSDPPVRRG